LVKFDSKSDEGIFLRYLEVSRVYNSRTSKVEELMHVRFNDHWTNKKLLEQENGLGFDL